MQDRDILITGGTDGMGKATAHQLAKMGARLLLVGRITIIPGGLPK